MQPRPDPRHRFIVANAEQAALRLDLRRSAPAGDERARQRGVAEIDRDGIVEHAAHAGRCYRPAVGATIPVEPFGDFCIALTKPTRRHADPYPYGRAADASANATRRGAGCARRRKLPFFVDPIERKLKIEKNDLISIYAFSQTELRKSGPLRGSLKGPSGDL